MSISFIQRKKKKDEFTEQLLKKGIEPNNYELNRMLAEYFENHTLGMPFYSPIKQQPYEESNKDNYNHNFKTFQEDIETVYQANIEANNKAVAIQEYYDLEKSKVRNALTRLALRVDNAIEALKSSSAVKQHVEAFDDLYRVELYGDSQRNIPYTTSFIDLLQKKVYTDKTNAKVNKLSMNNASVTISGLTRFNSYQTQGSLNMILNDIGNDVFVIAASSSNDSEKIVEINIDLGSLLAFNTVSFSYTSTRIMPCELQLSDDNENFIPVYDLADRDYVEWNFNTKKARYIKILCHKPEPDGINAKDTLSLYEYYFILKNISIAKESFEEKSIFVSKPISFDDLSSVIRLDATDMIFNNTRIDYFIGFDNGVDKIGWDVIKNHEDHELFMFDKKHKILNYHIEEFAHEGDGTTLYKLFKLPEGISKNSIKLTPAYNMWSVKRYVHDGDTDFSLALGDFSNHVANCEMTQMFMDCENYAFSIYPKTLYVMTQFISLEKSANLLNRFIRITDEDCKTDMEAEIRVFLNGYEVTAADNNQYSFALRKGVNKIQIAVYSTGENAIQKIYHNLNFRALTNNVFGFVPMKYTNNATLEKTMNDTYQYYTIKDGYLYVKCNPDDMIQSDLEDMAYFISYSCIKEDMLGYFEKNKISFRIMAVLTSNNHNVSPILCNYRITGK